MQHNPEEILEGFHMVVAFMVGLTGFYLTGFYVVGFLMIGFHMLGFHIRWYSTWEVSLRQDSTWFVSTSQDSIGQIPPIPLTIFLFSFIKGGSGLGYILGMEKVVSILHLCLLRSTLTNFKFIYLFIYSLIIYSFIFEGRSSRSTKILLFKQQRIELSAKIQDFMCLEIVKFTVKWLVMKTKCRGKKQFIK